MKIALFVTLQTLDSWLWTCEYLHTHTYVHTCTHTDFLTRTQKEKRKTIVVAAMALAFGNIKVFLFSLQKPKKKDHLEEPPRQSGGRLLSRSASLDSINSLSSHTGTATSPVPIQVSIQFSIRTLHTQHLYYQCYVGGLTPLLLHQWPCRLSD